MNMENLQRIVAFWRDCITAEGALEQSFSVSDQFRLGVRTRARLFLGKRDPFIFAEPEPFYLEKGNLYDFVAKAALKGQEIYFGYPLLMFYDAALRQHHVAPLFVMRLTPELQEDGLLLARAEPAPMLGAKAFTKLGLKQEEIAALNNEITEIFCSAQKAKLETILYLLKRETSMTFVEGIDPEKLSYSQTIHPYRGTIIYNRAVIYASEASAYNLHIINDLNQLATKKDLPTTALNYFRPSPSSNDTSIVPVLPFDFDEYQLQAIQHIANSKLTVVTGPPGTGKSQFIANVVVNLFLQKKRVLFVSHTGEAVRVVNQRINEQFANLMMQTGKKEVRQDLGRRLAEMVATYNDTQISKSVTVSKEALSQNWRLLGKETDYLRNTDRLHRRIARTLERCSCLAGQNGNRAGFWRHVYGCQISWLTMRLAKRHSSTVVAESIVMLKKRHVTLSREYTKDNYLSMILGGDQYGKLAAYIDAAQNKRPSQSGGDGHSERYVDAALKAMNVWSCTLKSLAATFPLRSSLFDYVIFDEASQIDLPSAAPALYRARRVVVVGDANQLLHIAKLDGSTEDDLAKVNRIYNSSLYPALIGYREASLFNSAKKSLTEPELQLKNHYRSNPKIANMFSEIFYGGRLRIRTKTQTLPKDMVAGVEWHDVSGTSYKHKNGSRYNPDEVDTVVALLKRILPKATAQHLVVGVATPYAMQRERITAALDQAFDAEELAPLRVLTVHQFQGTEVDILLFSTVIASTGDGGSDYWYMKNKQILNVAVSRARQVLIIIGDREHALASQSKLRAIAEYCLQNDDAQASVPNRPMNIFERKLLELLITMVPKTAHLEPQYVLDGRYTLDFALLSGRQKIAIELDGSQHEIIGGLPVFDDTSRDAYLEARGWHIVRISVYKLLKQPDDVILQISQILKRASINKREAFHE